MPNRRVGQIKQFDVQADIDQARYQLIKKLDAPGLWLVRILDGPNAGVEMRIHFRGPRDKYSYD